LSTDPQDCLHGATPLDWLLAIASRNRCSLAPVSEIRLFQAVPTLVSISQAWYPLGKADTSLYAEMRPNCTQHNLLVKHQE